MAETKENYFVRLNNIDVGDKIEKKNNLSYLSWAWAWAEVKKIHPDAIYTIYERDGELGPINYFTDGKTCWVKTGVTVNGIEHIEELPIMDFKNKSIPLASVTSYDVNKSIQRSLTKALARHGLGLYIYAGEDLPEESKKDDTEEKDKKTASKTKAKTKTEKQEQVENDFDLGEPVDSRLTEEARQKYYESIWKYEEKNDLQSMYDHYKVDDIQKLNDKDLKEALTCLKKRYGELKDE